MVASQAPTLPRVTSKDAACRHACPNASTTTSSASAGSRTIASASAYTIFPYRSYRSPRAASSPAAMRLTSCESGTGTFGSVAITLRGVSVASTTCVRRCPRRRGSATERGRPLYQEYAARPGADVDDVVNWGRCQTSTGRSSAADRESSRRPDRPAEPAGAPRLRWRAEARWGGVRRADSGLPQGQAPRRRRRQLLRRYRRPGHLREQVLVLQLR